MLCTVDDFADDGSRNRLRLQGMSGIQAVEKEEGVGGLWRVDR